MKVKAGSCVDCASLLQTQYHDNEGNIVVKGPRRSFELPTNHQSKLGDVPAASAGSVLDTDYAVASAPRHTTAKTLASGVARSFSGQASLQSRPESRSSQKDCVDSLEEPIHSDMLSGVTSHQSLDGGTGQPSVCIATSSVHAEDMRCKAVESTGHARQGSFCKSVRHTAVPDCSDKVTMHFYFNAEQPGINDVRAMQNLGGATTVQEVASTEGDKLEEPNCQTNCLHSDCGEFAVPVPDVAECMAVEKNQGLHLHGGPNVATQSSDTSMTGDSSQRVITQVPRELFDTKSGFGVNIESQRTQRTMAVGTPGKTFYALG